MFDVVMIGPCKLDVIFCFFLFFNRFRQKQTFKLCKAENRGAVYILFYVVVVVVLLLWFRPFKTIPPNKHIFCYFLPMTLLVPLPQRFF